MSINTVTRKLHHACCIPFMSSNHFDPLTQHDNADIAPALSRYGKGKEREQDLSSEHAGSSSSSEHGVAQTAYPPASEDTEETRRIEEAGPSFYYQVLCSECLPESKKVGNC